MWTKPYGNTGKDITAIGFGGMRFENPEDIDASAEVVLHAHQKGINYFDTAPHYCGDKSEDICGAAFKQMDRDTFYCSTKCSSPDGDELRKSIERSLKRLNVETIDFFHIWCLVTMDAWEGRKAGGAVAAAMKAKQEGLVNHVVVSSHLPGNDLAAVLEEGYFEGVTLGYCAINFPYREKAVETAGKLDLGVAAMNPLGGGLIPQHADRFSFLKQPDDPSIVASALRFVVSNPSITTALVGFGNKQHVDDAVAAVEGFTPWSPEQVDAIRSKVTESFDGLCTGCGYCMPCPEGLEVPRFMDAYNMKILHNGDDQQTINRMKWHWGIKADHAAACTLCGACESRCTQHLPITERMKEISKMGGS
jgi:hypothetical protein